MRATFNDSTLVLNQSNHPDVPAGGLVLEAGKPTPIPESLGGYLRALGAVVLDEPIPDTPIPPRKDGFE